MKKEKLRKEANKGITLIALVITIIVLLILTGVTIATLTGDNGILNQAGKAKDLTAEEEALEKVQLEIVGSFNDNGKYSSELAKTNLKNNLNISESKIQDKGNGKLKVEYNGYTFKVDENGKVSIADGVKVGDIFDNTGTVKGKLHIGDFLNYTAGTWTEQDMQKIAESGAKIAANGTNSLPSSCFQFGGFTLNSSKDGNAKECNSSYNYVQEIKSDGAKQAVTGWRVFDVTDNEITLISAGCPEDYRQQNGANNSYISEYILTGNVNSNVDASALGLGTASTSTYKPRDWSMYVNNNYGATKATALSKKNLDDWYTKYTNTTNADTWTNAIFQKIYKTDINCVNNGMYESLIDNYSYYWLSSAITYTHMYYTNPDSRTIKSVNTQECGVRVLVSLSSDIELSKESVGTKTITSRNNDYNYNIFNIE